MDKRNDAGYVAIPESYTRRQLNALYREIPLKDTTSRLLRKYFNAKMCIRDRYDAISFTSSGVNPK